jgi:hypothetical protein
MKSKRALKASGLLLATTFGLFAVMPVWAEDERGEALTALEGKLHGVWKGQGPCDGQLALRSDGMYERRHHGPGGNNSTGAWKVRWDALPPTLVLTCKTSDDSAYTGKTLDVKILQLDNATLIFQYQNATPNRYVRDKK